MNDIYGFCIDSSKILNKPTFANRRKFHGLAKEQLGQPPQPRVRDSLLSRNR